MMAMAIPFVGAEGAPQLDVPSTQIFKEVSKYLLVCIRRDPLFTACLGYQIALAEGVWYNFWDNKNAYGPKCSPAL